DPGQALHQAARGRAGAPARPGRPPDAATLGRDRAPPCARPVGGRAPAAARHAPRRGRPGGAFDRHGPRPCRPVRVPAARAQVDGGDLGHHCPASLRHGRRRDRRPSRHVVRGARCRSNADRDCRLLGRCLLCSVARARQRKPVQPRPRLFARVHGASSPGGRSCRAHLSRRAGRGAAHRAVQRSYRRAAPRARTRATLPRVPGRSHRARRDRGLGVVAVHRRL
ncbi:MAG: serine esterase, putative, partial [uncultured Sphingomonadaceae bacterium]